MFSAFGKFLGKTAAPPVWHYADVVDYGIINGFYSDCVWIAPDKFLMVWYETSGTIGLTARVGTVSGTDVSFGAIKNVNPANSQFIKLVKVRDNKAVVVCKSFGHSGKGIAFVLTVAGTTITVASALEVQSTWYIDYYELKYVTTDTLIMMSGTSRARILTFNDTTNTLTAGAESNFDSAPYSGFYIGVLSPTKAVVIWRSSDKIQAKTVTISGTTLTQGSVLNELDTVVGSADAKGLVAVTANTLFYLSSDSNVYIVGSMLTVSGDVITKGAYYVLNSEPSNGFMDVTKTDAANVHVVGRNSNGSFMFKAVDCSSGIPVVTQATVATPAVSTGYFGIDYSGNAQIIASGGSNPGVVLANYY